MAVFNPGAQDAVAGRQPACHQLTDRESVGLNRNLGALMFWR
jgi:hypothetical protein